MATPVGTPDVSLLPQPAVPTPIEPMRGGFGGTSTGSENVSLLPQPATPAPIEPMRGGSSENVSLLPQPEVPVPIVPMKGGGERIPSLQLNQFQRDYKGPDPDDIEVKLDAKIVRNYVIDLRVNQWGDKAPKTAEESLQTMKTFSFDDKQPIHIFYIPTLLNYFQIQTYLKNQFDRDVKVRFVLVNQIEDKEEFSKTYKHFIQFVSNPIYRSRIVFFLFDKSKLQIKFTENEKKGGLEKKRFLYMEPDAIDIPYKQGSTQHHLLWIPGTTTPKEVTANYSAITPVLQAEQITLQKKDLAVKKLPKLASELKDQTLYSIDTKKDKTYFNHYYIRVEFADVAGPDLPPAGGPSKIVPPPPPTSPPTAVAPPKPVSYLLKRKETEDIDLGGVIYSIRKATVPVQTAWEKGEFTDSEKELFTALGLTDDFFTIYPSPEKDKLKAQRADFLLGIVMSSCFNDTNLLMKSDCEKVREFLQSLLEIRQLDRLRAYSEVMNSFTDVSIDLIRSVPARTSVDKGKVKSFFENITTLLSKLDFTKKSHTQSSSDLSTALPAAVAAATRQATGPPGSIDDLLNALLSGMNPHRIAPSNLSAATVSDILV